MPYIWVSIFLRTVSVLLDDTWEDVLSNLGLDHLCAKDAQLEKYRPFLVCYTIRRCLLGGKGACLVRKSRTRRGSRPGWLSNTAKTLRWAAFEGYVQQRAILSCSCVTTWRWKLFGEFRIVSTSGDMAGKDKCWTCVVKEKPLE